MNILFLSNDPQLFVATSAVRARMKTYAKIVAASGGSLHIVSRAPSTATVRDENLILHGVKTGAIKQLVYGPLLVRRLITTHHISVISAQDPFEHGLLAWLGSQGTQAKLHLQVHTDVLSPWFVRPISIASCVNRVRVALTHFLLPRAHGIRVVSERIRFSLKARFGTRIVEPICIPIAVSVHGVRQSDLPTSYGFTFLAIGRMEPEKRFQDLIEAIGIVVRSYPDSGLVLVGDGRERRWLERLVQRKGLSAHVTFLGSRPDARSLLRATDAFVQASAYEGYGITLVEAALAEVPIVTTEVGLVRDVLIPGEHVYTAPIASPESFARQCEEVRATPEEAARRAKRAHDRVAETLISEEASARAIMEHIQQSV